MTNGYLRVAAVSSKVRVADVNENVKNICLAIDELVAKGVDVALFPELCITGYTCGDLLKNADLLAAAAKGVDSIGKYISDKRITVIVGYPKICGGALYNCASVLSASGRTDITKSYLPDYSEFYEKRRFQPGDNALDPEVVELECGVLIAVDICEDLWAPVAPSTFAAMKGAEVIFNLSASNDVLYKYNSLNCIIQSQSKKCSCGYVYASSGPGESSTDLVFLPKQIIAECGEILASNNRYRLTAGTTYTIADIDVELIRANRLNNSSFHDCAAHFADEKGCGNDERLWSYDFGYKLVNRPLSKLPFVPDGKDAVEHLDEVVSMQTAGLLQRLSVLPSHNIVLGVSGGLDSTLALLVAVNAFRTAGYPLTDIMAITMPGFGTSGRTYRNAVRLMELLGVSTREISIKNAVLSHFKDINHDPGVIDVTYENAQARERTQILMDVANQSNAIVLGTGDLSEIALGWCTYNGDHISMYGINAGLPKTLIRAIVARIAEGYEDGGMPEVASILRDIVATPISPELKPTDGNGEISQVTENSVGPYELQDFYLYYWLKYSFPLQKVFYLAVQAFECEYAPAEILKWLKVFVVRFFTQQFKRSCMPDGPKVTEVSLSPRGDWRMPSDASMALWLRQIEDIALNL